MKSPWTKTASLIFGLLLAAGALAAELERDGLVVSQTGATSLLFASEAEFGQATLRVTGPSGYVFEQRVEKGDQLSFDLLADTDELSDGSYRWSLAYSSPVSEETERELARARLAGDVGVSDRLKAEGKFSSGSWSGSFLVVDGRMIAPESSGPVGEGGADLPLKGAAELPTKDFVILDDLIVDGSACIGTSCVSGETFGFDTIRLKETTLRIRFQDTSVGSYPTTDWQLTANDSPLGGLNKFSIDDLDAGRTPFTLEAGARNHSLYVDDAGRVGMGTSTPVEDIHVITGDTPTLRLQQDGSSGFSPQTWDVAGNDAGFFVRDVTGGSTLPFRIRLGAATNTMVIDGDSQVGVGILAPTHKLHVLESGTSGTLRIVGKFENNGPASLQLVDNVSGDNWVFSNKPTGFEISKGGTGNIEMALDAGGNLFIEGQLTTGMSVYPDYVFEEGYDLMSLDELESFIEANGHLPNIRAEDEVEHGKRVNLSELSRGLLEKVEELTLYTLEQHRTDQELRQTIDVQSRLIQELQARLTALEAER